MSEESRKPNVTQPQPEGNNKGRASRTIIIILSALIVGSLVAIWLIYQNKEKAESENVVLQEDLDETRTKLESISNELDLKIEEIQKLGGDVEELRMIREQMQTEVDELERNSRIQAARFERIQDKVEGYRELLLRKDEQIAELTAQNEALLSENTELKQEQRQLEDSITGVVSTTNELAEKVEIASRLKAENIRVYAVNRRGKEKERDSYRNRQIEQLKVEFNIAENNVAEVGGKDIRLRVVDPNGEVIFDVATGSGTFIHEGKELFFTANQEILFDNTRQEVSFLYERPEDYLSGKHEIELFADGYLIGKSNFMVK
jgi:hypothetical protein